jgi:zinc protease
VDGGLAKEDFELTRAFLKKYVLHYAPTTAERLAYALDDRFYGISGSHLELFRRMMDEITLDEVNAAIRKYWKTTDLSIVFVTNDAPGLRQALSTDAASPIAYKGPKAESVLAEDKEIALFTMKVEPSKISIVPVAELFFK